MSIKCFDLWHQIYNLHPIVWLFSKWVAKEIQLLQVLELRQLNQKLVEVSQPVVSQEQNFQELIFFEAVDATNFIVLTVDFLASEISYNIVQVSQL